MKNIGKYWIIVLITRMRRNIMSLSDFSNRLNELMVMENLSRRALSSKTGLQRKSILNWLSGKNYPRYDALINLADYFMISIDYLLCLSSANYGEFKKSEKLNESTASTFIERLNTYMTANNMTKYRLAKNLGLGQTTVERWFKYGSMPETEVIIRIAGLMKESVDYLLGRDRT